MSRFTAPSDFSPFENDDLPVVVHEDEFVGESGFARRLAYLLHGTGCCSSRLADLRVEKMDSPSGEKLPALLAKR